MENESDIQPSRKITSSDSATDIFMFDYDGTLTLESGVIPEETIAVLREINKRNIAVLGVVSGRNLDFLMTANQELSNTFSFLVAENGAISYFLDTNEKSIRGLDWTRQARSVFSNAPFQISFFEIIASAKRGFSGEITRILRETRLPSKIVLNKDSVMVTPPNVDKGTGVASAVAHYGSTKSIRLTCFGDGENDEALFGPADFSVAVSNAVDSLKIIADFVTSRPGGLGVEDFLRERFLTLK
ncbi:MAG TPA: HAD family hydrolase [Nitrososphaerales archaeon]|nr:HAD family hydrolase [Nitrososphaerales archaeon]